MTTNSIKEFLGIDCSKNSQTLELEGLSPAEWAYWLTWLGYRWQVQTSGPWGSDIRTDMDSLHDEVLNEVRIVHSDMIATLRERID